MIRIPVQESLIDFARPDLSQSVWTRVGNTYQLSQLAGKKILSVLEQCPVNLLGIASEMHIVGSITTNLFVEDTDIDLHILPRNPQEWSEEDVKEILQWFEDNREEIDGYVGTHPVEVYIQVDLNQDFLSEGVYDVRGRRWLKGPKIFSENYNPYDDFSEIADEIRSSAEGADLLLGELKRDVIDYETIKKALEKMSSEQKKKFLQLLQSKLNEIEGGIEKLVQMKKEWTDARKSSSRPVTPEQALKDVEMATNWKNTNAIFKFLSRYRYLKVIHDLEGFIKGEDDLESDDVVVIKHILGSDLCQN